MWCQRASSSLLQLLAGALLVAVACVTAQTPVKQAGVLMDIAQMHLTAFSLRSGIARAVCNKEARRSDRASVGPAPVVVLCALCACCCICFAGICSPVSKIAGTCSYVNRTCSTVPPFGSYKCAADGSICCPSAIPGFACPVCGAVFFRECERFFRCCCF